MTETPDKVWWVYMILADDGAYYTGVTTDVERRFQEHREGKRGARYFRGRKPLAVVYRESGHNRSSACRREAEIKRLRREQKQALIDNSPA
ncbi:MAG: GIY-YIG nuclease family protein [Pseudomonadales bacterium]